ncbi:PREDICTED: UDP-glycosyltransferase 13-like [Nelumbo nucifera]|uniref:Glycosyltransferase n=2 Tax=Nelumbo nucifera TaxID=4432 RepID=A0A822YU80_NELNU|nr:PREDICTED: UDP-glycosyltransferase 13-like [Nelumbo nucifera]DAD34979.1 TPA_asm: hypothetical protein HUJ06_005619 [Nelumbo nucifera]
MEMSSSSDLQILPPHVALLPSSGMGHLVPFVRLAAALARRNCLVTFITTHPTVSLSESRLVSRLLSAFPHVTPLEFHLLPLDHSTANSKDPFFLQFEAIRRSAHLLSPLLSSCSDPPLSALITDVSLASAFISITDELRLPNYILFTSSAWMLSLCLNFPTFVVNTSTNLSGGSATASDDIEIPGVPPVPKSWLPPLLLDLSNLFTTQFMANGQELIKSNGILINTFGNAEQATVAALNEGKVVNGLPPVTKIGPLAPCEFEKGSSVEWLDGQPAGSVLYVSFGSRTAMSREQIRELGDGLVRSGCRFLWVVKDKKVDREDEEELGGIVGQELMERMKDNGLVVKNWVDQGVVLAHPAVGGFLSHCGWNSVTEAAWNGVPVLAWPQHGDQSINAQVMEKSGIGMWVKSWGWGRTEVVKGEEIGQKIGEMMGNDRLKAQAANIREESRRAVEVGGGSYKELEGIIEKWKISRI